MSNTAHRAITSEEYRAAKEMLLFSEFPQQYLDDMEGNITCMFKEFIEGTRGDFASFSDYLKYTEQYA